MIDRFPHDGNAFTQGLEVHHGELLESTGLRGESTLRRVDIETGNVLQQVSLLDTEFAEGLTRVQNRLIQLTWQEQVAHVYDVDSFEELETFPYEGEGWGLCYDGSRLVMSDGSSRLAFRDPVTFALQGEVEVTVDGASVSNLNELECVGPWVFSNVWQTDRILMIDASTGEVAREFLMNGLLTREEAVAADVLNGIAFIRETSTFYVTGKLWPYLYELDFGLSPELLSGSPPEASESGDAGMGAAAGGSAVAAPGASMGSGCSLGARSGSGPLGAQGHGLGAALLVASGLWGARRRAVRQ